MARCRRQSPARAKSGCDWRRPASIPPMSAAAAAATGRWNIRASFRTATALASSTRSATASRGSSIGQRVWLFNGQRNGRAFGTAAEYIALAEHLVTPLPDNLSFAEGATLGIPGMTAWTCLYCDGPIVGQTVLVTGGAGAVGHYAVQFAKWGGAKVIATVSSAAKAEQARLAGADLVINYKSEDVVAKAMAFTGQRGVDRVVDVDFGGNIDTTLKLMGLNSTIAVYATNGNRTPVVPMRELMEKCIALRALVLFALPQPLLAAAQVDITKWLTAGPRIHNVAAQFALSDTAQAHLAVEKGDKMGTVIVDCAR